LITQNRFEHFGLLASGFGHNLGSALTAIKGYAQMMRLDLEDSEEPGLILEEIGFLEKIIGSLMVKSQRYDDERDIYVNLNALLEKEVNFLKNHLFFKHRVKTVMQLDAQIPSVYGKYSYYSQVMFHILRNSIEAMYQSNVKELIVHTFFDDSWISVKIRDSGCGIPVTIQDRILDLGFSTKQECDEPDHMHRIHYGFGLPLARFFIEQCRGEISIDSSEGAGTAVQIKYPNSGELTAGIN